MDYYLIKLCWIVYILFNPNTIGSWSEAFVPVIITCGESSSDAVVIATFLVCECNTNGRILYTIWILL